MVTGAAQGMGRAISLALAAEGAEVWAIDRNGERLAGLVGESSAITTRTVDVTSTAAVEALAAEAGPVQVLVNCAGVVPQGSILDCTDEEWTATLDVNATSMHRTMRAFIPGMLAGAGGSIVNISSTVSSVTSVPNRYAYGASKAAVIGMSKAVAADFIRRGVRCNVIYPGTVDTPSLHERLAAFDDPEAARRDFIARQPMGRFGTPDEIAALVVHLASDESGFTTGSVYTADGGMTL